MYKLLNGDCIELMKKLPDSSIDMILTDPPYGISYKTNRRKDKTHDFCTEIANDKDLTVAVEMIRQSYRVMKDDSAIFVFASPRNMFDVENALTDSGFKIKNHIVWVKNNWTAGDLKGAFGYQWEILFLAVKGRPLIRGKRITDVWHFDRVPPSVSKHQNQKPTDMLMQAIEKFTDSGGLVLDPFMGSGSTGVACVNTNRNFIGMELEEKYFDIAKESIEEASASAVS